MKPGEHKTVQARILAYAEAIGWTVVFREEAKERRAGFPTRRKQPMADRNVRPPLTSPAALKQGSKLSVPSRTFCRS